MLRVQPIQQCLLCRSTNQPAYYALNYVPSTYVSDVMTETLAILAKNKVERLNNAHQNVMGATEISKSSCIYRLYHA